MKGATMQGKTAIVTGAGSGMGRLMAQRLAEKGWKVALIDVNEAALQELARGSNLFTPYPCDVSDAAAVAATVARIRGEIGPVDRLVHAAALMPTGSVETMPTEQFMRLMAVNYGGTVNFTKAVLPDMLQRRSGEIIVFGSIAGYIPTQEMGAYCATKAAVVSYMEVLMHENEKAGVDFLLVCPPVVDTPLLAQMQNGGPETIAARIRQGKAMIPASVLDAIERALTSHRQIVYPGEANAAQLLRRLMPGLMWRLTTRANRKAG
jgi:NAD(P)-dependent dehydrogenase (short-subunit alcohol dehydrogenase family)